MTPLHSPCRLILIEDVPELQLQHPNSVGLIATRAGSSLSFTNAAEYITRSIDLIVQHKRVGGERRIQSIQHIRAT